MKVFLVPGHGGKDPGCVGPTGLQEKVVALQITERLERLLVAGGFTVGLSRMDDRYISPDDQRKAANAWGADFVVAIHLNGHDNRGAKGFEVWTTKGLTRSDALATEVFHSMEEQLKGEVGRKDMVDGDVDKESNFSVIMCIAPAVLVEFGFLSNPETEEKFRRPAMIDACARAVAVGLDRWIGKTMGAR